MRVLIACLAVILLVGCDEVRKQTQRQQQREEPRAQKKQEQEPGSYDAVDTVIIQRPKFDAGRRASQKIREISAEKNSDLNDVLKE